MARQRKIKRTDKADDTKSQSADDELKQIKETILKGKGNLTYTAQLLNIHRSTLYEWIEKNPEIKTWLRDAEEAQIDHVENALFTLIDTGETAATIFYLKTKGKNRGYVERQENHHSGGIDLKTARELTDEQLLAIAAQGQPARGSTGVSSPQTGPG